MIETRQECEHTALWRSTAYAPKVGERIYCERCCDMRYVISIVGAWRAFCHGCKWWRSRMDPEKLKEHVIKHLNESTHFVTVENHDRSARITVRTPHAARNFGQNPASTPPRRRHDAATGTDDALF